MSEDKRIILGITGSVAATRSPDIFKGLRDNGLKVSVVMTKSAEHFITPLTLASLVGEEVYSDMFIKDSVDWQMPHIDLAKTADVLLIAPATANIIGKLAHGIADDLLTCIALATKAKILIAPAMNTETYKNQIVLDNVKKLKSFGMEFIDPIEGELACGDIGIGHIADNEMIINAVVRSLK